MKSDLIVVGAFPEYNSVIVGGVVFNCATLIKHSNILDYNIIPFDSTQKSNPPPYLLKRILYSFVRLVRYMLFVRKYSGAKLLVMAALQASWFEKLFMCGYSRLFNIKTSFYPLGCQIIDDISKSRLQKFLFKLLIKLSDRILCQGENWKNFFENELKVPGDKLIIFPSWTATPELLAFGHERNRNFELFCNASDNANFRIVFVGWIEKEKGVLELVDAFIEFNKKFPNAQLIFVGDGTLRGFIESETIKHGIESSIKVTGWLAHSEVIDQYLNSDLFILPSYNEGLPNSMIEAMCCKIPCVLTAVGSIPTYSKHLEHSYLIRPGTNIDIYEAFIYAIKNYPQFLAMADSAHVMAENNFTVKNLNHHLLSVFDGEISS